MLPPKLCHNLGCLAQRCCQIEISPDEEHFCFYLDIFQVKFGGITKVQTLRGTLGHIKSGFEKSSLKDSKKQGGGVKAKLKKKTKQKQIFFGWLP